MTFSEQQRLFRNPAGLAAFGIALLALSVWLIATPHSAAVQGSSAVAVVSAASFAVEVAPDSIAAAFGTRMATRTEVASTQPLPTTLAGASVRVNGVLARLFFVSPSQINFIIPAGIAAGAATVTVNSEDGSVLTGTAQVRDVAPAIVAANADGVGAPAAVLLRLSPAGAQAFESIVERDPASNKLVPKAINFGTGDRLFLILYVCGIRNAPDRDGNRDNGVAESIRVMFGGIAFQPIYAGPAPDFAGLDQINIEIDRRLSGRVSIQVEYEAITSNVGEMAIAWPGREAAAMSLSSSSVTSVYGQSVTFTAHVSAIGGTPTGSVIFRDGARSLGTGELIGGRAEFNAETLTVGTHRITAYYGGNGGFMGTWVALQPGQSVGKAGTTIELSAAANPTVTGQTATFIVQVSVASPGAGRPSGQLRFTDNGVLIGRVPLDIAGRAVLSVPLVTAGKHPISAAYEGDANFSESNGVLSGGQQVNKGATTIVVSSSQNPSGRDQSVTLIATVGVLAPAAGTPTGIVQFKDGGAVLGAPITLLDRRAELALSTLRLGAHLITAEYYGDPHFFGSASLIFSQNIEVPPLQVGRIVRAPLSYAGDEILIQGSGFSSNPSAHEVQMIDDQGKSVTAKVEAASPGQLRVRVPFGAGSGRVKVVLSPNEGESPDRLELATSVSGVVQQAVRQPDGSTLRAPVPGVTLRAFGLSGLIATAVTTSSGSFVVKFPAAASFFETIDLEVDGAAVPGGLPYPTEKRKMAVARSRDNPYSGDVDESGRLQANIIELKRVGAATALLAQGTRQSPTAAEIIFDRGGSTILCPGGGGNCALTLTALDPGRAPANLPIGYFSSAIAQITPFGATLAPGGRLSFPNVDGIPIGTPVRLFRFEQTSGPNLGKFVDVGSATVSSDGARIDTTANAVTQTSYYFVSRQWPRATIVGFVSEADGRPVRRAVVDVRGQSVFTDNNGGFVLGNVPVITSDGFNDPLVLEVTYARSDGRVDRAQRGVTISANTTVSIGQGIVLPREVVDRPPAILAPPSLVIREGEARTFGLLAIDPDGALPTVTVAGAPFASVTAAGNGAHTLALSPGAGSAGGYVLTIRAADRLGREIVHSLPLTVEAAGGGAPIAHYVAVVATEDTPVSIALGASNAGAGGVIYTFVNLPGHGSLRGVPPNVIYTPDPNFEGIDSFSYKVTGSGGESNVASVFIAVRPVNDPPVLRLANSAFLTVNAGETAQIDLSVEDPDIGQAYTFNVAGAPSGASFIAAGTQAQFRWTPTFLQPGAYSLSFSVVDDGAPQLSASVTGAIAVSAKWARTSGPEGGTIFTLLSAPPVSYAATSGGVYRSTDNGQSWTQFSDGLSDAASLVYSLETFGGALFAGTGDGLFRRGASDSVWTRANQSAAGIVSNAKIFELRAIGGVLFAGLEGQGFHRSLDGGQTWTPTLSGTSGFTEHGQAIETFNGAIFAATDKGIYRSTNNGQNWTSAGNGLPSGFSNILCLKVANGGLWAGLSSGGIYRFDTVSQRWAQTGFASGLRAVSSLETQGGALFAGTGGHLRSTPLSGEGVYRSMDNGATWNPVNAGMEDNSIQSLKVIGGALFAGTGSGIYRTADLGAAWQKRTAGISNSIVESLAYENGVLRAAYGNSYDGLATIAIFPPIPKREDIAVRQTAQTNTIDEGQRWNSIPASSGLPPLHAIRPLAGLLFAMTNGGLFYSNDDGQIWQPARRADTGEVLTSAYAIEALGSGLYVGTGRGMFKSTDGGRGWVEINTGLENEFQQVTAVYALKAVGQTLVAATYNGIYLTDNGGQRWSWVKREYVFRALEVAGNYIYAGAHENGVFRSGDQGRTWEAINVGLTGNALGVRALKATGNVLYAGTRQGVFYSTDSGQRWAPIGGGLAGLEIRSLESSGSGIFAGTFGRGVFVLGNHVQSWTETSTNLPVIGRSITAIGVRGANLYLGTLGGGIYRSTNRGQSWEPIGGGLPQNAIAQAFEASGSGFFVGLFGAGVYRLSTDGVSWIPSGLAGQNVNAVRSNAAGVLFAATDAGMRRSMDQGASWLSAGLGGQRVTSLALVGNQVFAGTYGAGIQVSSDNGASWAPIGLGNLFITTLVAEPGGAVLFAGTDGGGIYRSVDGGVRWTSVNQDLPSALSVYSLVASGSKLYAGSIYGVFLSENHGATWKQINAGLADLYVTSMAIQGRLLIAGTRIGGVFVSQIP